MNRKRRYGPQPRETARLTAINVIPLPKELTVGDVALIKWWDANYVIEFEGREYTISQINIVCPSYGLRGEQFCPYCSKLLRRDGQFYICGTPGCSFRYYVNRPAFVLREEEGSSPN
jgi:hypothetical protein